MKKEKLYNVWFWIVLLTLLGLILRIVCCFWGYPYRLHPDEPSVVENTLDMIDRQSWEANVYNRPDQFEIKSCVFLFQIFSRLIYHLPPTDAYTDHMITFYLIARIYTAVLGAAMIPLSVVLNKLLFINSQLNVKKIQIFTAILISFSPTLTIHSSYATPDIPLAFLIMLFAVFFIKYMRSGSLSNIALCAVATGLAIATKYPGAILCVFIAIAVIYRSIKEHKTKKIFSYGALSIVLVLVTVFFLAPNLFTNIRTTIRTIHLEARSEHLGSDGLGFGGNLLFYLKVMLQNTGLLGGIPCLFAALWFLVHKPRYEYLALAIGGVWLICMSALSLHWIRWGVPAYSFYFILVAVGIVLMQEYLHKFKPLGNILFALILANASMLNIAQTKNVLCEDSRIVAYNYCKDNGITSQESMSEGFSPFYMPNPFSIWKNFEWDGAQLTMNNEEYLSCRYLIIGSHYWGLFAAEKDRYATELNIYNNFENVYRLIYHLQADNIYDGDSDNRMFSLSIFKNIVRSIQYINRSIEATGYDIYIYDMTQLL